MTEDTSTDLLSSHGIRPTANRLLVARALAAAIRPLSLAELETRLLTMDRSSIFRVLTLFRDHHLVHVIEGGSDGVHYELCRSHSHDTDDDQHVHFHCEQCHRTYCLESIAVPVVPVPEGFQLSSVSYMLKGLCPQCRFKQRR
ncbi:MAG: transcriptional repressor [Bacteroidaceae bacterium]|nr:transcriptional repressor [Bacteroidaceae bacterium]